MSTPAKMYESSKFVKTGRSGYGQYPVVIFVVGLIPRDGLIVPKEHRRTNTDREGNKGKGMSAARKSPKKLNDVVYPEDRPVAVKSRWINVPRGTCRSRWRLYITLVPVLLNGNNENETILEIRLNTQRSF